MGQAPGVPALLYPASVSSLALLLPVPQSLPKGALGLSDSAFLPGVEKSVAGRGW